MTGTKKIGSAGRFGSRYGVKVKRRLVNIEKKQRSTYECPKCGKVSVKRVMSGIWQCNKCDVKFAGRAYVPKGE